MRQTFFVVALRISDEQFIFNGRHVVFFIFSVKDNKDSQLC